LVAQKKRPKVYGGWIYLGWDQRKGRQTQNVIVGGEMDDNRFDEMMRGVIDPPSRMDA